MTDLLAALKRAEKLQERASSTDSGSYESLVALAHEANEAARNLPLAAIRERIEGLERALANIRDSVLHGRGPLEGYDIDSDITNAVLGIIDDETAALTNGEPR